MTERRFWIALFGVLVLAALLRTLFPTADPPWNPTVGVVWHDEGAWVHNARNRVLWGTWSTDAWNPLFIAPVFTVLEYVSFALLGVGVWQARLVSEVGGLASVLLIAGGVRRLAGSTAGLIAAALVGTNFFYVMYNRAALMESTMVAMMTASWYCYVRAQDRPGWGVAAGGFAVLAFFTKAAAAFFVAALALDAVVSWLLPQPDQQAARRRSMAAIAGLAAGFLVALAIFVGPYWTEYRFYNWQMSVTRKPSYDLKSLLDRASWFPVLHDVFTQNWLLIVAATTSALTALARWRTLAAGERLLLWWIGLGTIELFVHDVAERRFVMFIPAVAATAALALAGRRAASVELAQVTRARAMLALPAVAYGCYVAAAALIRLLYLPEIHAGVMRSTVGSRPRWRCWRRSRSTRAGRDCRAPWRVCSGRRGPRWRSRRSSARWTSRCSSTGRAGAATRTSRRRSPSDGSCRPARWSTASWRTACRSRITSSRCSSGATSAITTIAGSVMTCDIF